MSTTIQQVPTGTYGLDPIHSTFGFGVRYNKLATFRSTFDEHDRRVAQGPRRNPTVLPPFEYGAGPPRLPGREPHARPPLADADLDLPDG